MYFNFKTAIKKHKRLFYNDADFLLMMTIINNALFKYNTLNNLRQQMIFIDKNEIILRFKKSALNQLILQKCTKVSDVIDESMFKDTFLAVFKSTLINADYL
jgi:hypothetical protein